MSSGFATIRCAILPDGQLADCVVVEESLPDQGFGEAAIVGARRARASPRTVAGAAVGASVQFTTRFIEPIGD